MDRKTFYKAVAAEGLDQYNISDTEGYSTSGKEYQNNTWRIDKVISFENITVPLTRQEKRNIYEDLDREFFSSSSI